MKPWLFRAIYLVSMTIFFLRFTVRGVLGHGVEGVTWEDTYEAFAHIWVGMLIVLAFIPALRASAIIAIVLLTALEGFAFAIR